MKTKLILKTTGLLIFVMTLFIFSSCTKSAKESLTKDQNELQNTNPESTTIDERNLSESDEDLTTVDYKEFYEQLAPHGEWIQVPFEEIGLKSNTSQIEGPGINDFTVSDLFGVKKANASSEVNSSMVYVWKPSVELAVTADAAVAPVYVPYSNGQWVNTDAGWYFKAPTPVEETVSHYGRWVNSTNAGWLWVPGRVWAPAWVDWKQNDEYVSWAPLPPNSYLINGNMQAPVIADNNYLIVERKYFVEPEVYRYNNIFFDNGNRVPVSLLTGTEGIIFTNNVIINRGPDVNVIQRIYGRNIELVKIQHVKNYNDVRYSDREYKVYTPGFVRYKNKGNNKVTVIEPKSFRKYDEWKIRKSEEKEYRKEDREIKKDEKDYKKENNGNDNVKKNNGNDNFKKSIGNENVKKNDGNDKGKSNENKDNVKKNNSNDNGNKNKESNDNGNKHEGKDNGKGKN